MIDKKFFKFLGSLSKGTTPVWVEPNGAACVSGRGWQAYLSAGSVPVPHETSKVLYSTVNLMSKCSYPFLEEPAESSGMPKLQKMRSMVSLSTALMKDIKSVLWALPDRKDCPEALKGVCLELVDDVWNFIATDAEVLHARRVGYVEAFWARSTTQFLIPTPLARNIVLKSSVISNADAVLVNEGTDAEYPALRLALNGVTYLIECTSEYPTYRGAFPDSMFLLGDEIRERSYRWITDCCRFHPAVSLESLLGFLCVPFEDRMQMFSAGLEGCSPKRHFEAKKMEKLLKVWPVVGEFGIRYDKKTQRVNFVGHNEKDTVAIAARKGS